MTIFSKKSFEVIDYGLTAEIVGMIQPISSDPTIQKKLELWKWSINEVSIDRGEYCALPGKFDAHLCRVEYESCKISAI